jgi:flagella basal body P-ring formation protein FlgA
MPRIPTALLGMLALCATATGLSASKGAPEGGQELIAVAREALLADLRQEHPDLSRIELTPAAHPVAPVPAGAELSAVLPRHALAARECVWVSVRRGGRSIASVPVWFSVRAMSPVLVMQRTHGAHEPLDRSEVALEERDVAGLVGKAVDQGTDLSRLRTRHAVAAGRVLLQRDLEERPQIFAGQEVDVGVTLHSIAIETRAVALREARLGESVVLRNPDSAETYRARVTGPGRAEVIDP